MDALVTYRPSRIERPRCTESIGGRAHFRALHPADVERYDDLLVGDRKRILGSLIDAVIVKRDRARVPIEDRATILWCGKGPDDMPRSRRGSGPVRSYVP